MLVIFSFLSHKELLSCHAVCKRWNHILSKNDEVLWKDPCCSLWKVGQLHLCTDSWKIAFLQLPSARNISLVKRFLHPQKQSRMQSLDFSFFELNILPSALFSLSNLRSLRLHHNQLKSLPSSISFLCNLQTLDLSKNRLNSLPPEISFLKKLELLNLEHNDLRRLPSQLSLLTDLRILRLSYNPLLTSVPFEHNSMQDLVILTNQSLSLKRSFEI